MAKQAHLLYALKDNKITSISTVESGLKCGCICPACGVPLVARKGVKRMHHFSHHVGDCCEYGYETSLHLAAKDILSKAKKMIIPPVYVHFPGSPKKDELVHPKREIGIDHVELEKRFNDVIPDVVVYSGNKYFFLEVFVTHPIDDKKLAKLKELNISTIEINLSNSEKSISFEELSKILLEDSAEKIWKYNSVSNRWYQQFIDATDKRSITSRGMVKHIDNCPIAVRTRNGKSYANFIDDCQRCRYCISNSIDGYVLCSGSKGIASVKDFSIPEKSRIDKRKVAVAEDKLQAFAAKNRCPNCGARLIKRNSQSGSLWECSNYPDCKFAAGVDSATGKIQMEDWPCFLV